MGAKRKNVHKLVKMKELHRKMCEKSAKCQEKLQSRAAELYLEVSIA